MLQKTANGLTLIDCGKVRCLLCTSRESVVALGLSLPPATLPNAWQAAIEHFMKRREKDMFARTDRYMLVTCAPKGLRVADKHPFSHFTRELKDAQARDLSPLGSAVKTAFDSLNLSRLCSGVDR
eukprot:scaffold4990_cov387-Prasinococcus_capsulatus_cf.AAC.22